MTRRLAAVSLCLPLILSGPALAAPFLAELDGKLAAQREEIEKDRKKLNKECGKVPASNTEKAMGCQLWRDDVTRRMEQYKKDFRSLELVREAVAGERDFFDAIPQDDIRIPLGIQILAKRLRWSPEKQARLEKALKDIGFDGLPEITAENVQNGWNAIWKQADDQALARAADRAGPRLPVVGQQGGNDCVIAAMATASGRPYDEVAAQAGSLIQKGEWRHPVYRDDPQQVLKQGLNGGEVIMLGESLGGVEVVPSSKFEATLKGGRPVLVNVVIPPPRAQFAPTGTEAPLGNHQIVLTRTFRHEGKTWYEMADSRHPDYRFFLTPAQLNLIIQEKGIALDRKS